VVPNSVLPFPYLIILFLEEKNCNPISGLISRSRDHHMRFLHFLPVLFVRNSNADTINLSYEFYTFLDKN
jgi:hypothetical protein